MSPVQQATSEHTRRIVILLGIVVGGLWLAMTAYFLLDSKQTTAIGKSAVAIHVTSPVAIGSTPSATYKAPRVATTPLVHHEAVSASQWSFVQKTTPTTGSMHIYQTSDATVKSIGGGGNTGGIATVSGHSNSGRGVQSSGISFGGNMLALAASTPLAAPGASNANEIATTTTSGHNAASVSPRKLPGHEEEWYLDPVGDVTWGLMILLAVAYATMCGVRRVRLKRQ